MRRGGRIDIDIRLDMPSDKDRFEIFKEHLRLLPNKIEDEDLLMISRASSGFVTSDIA
jgi:SpoVK/Ycf46/Vps4 family AAA+-type ATPase